MERNLIELTQLSCTTWCTPRELQAAAWNSIESRTQLNCATFPAKITKNTTKSSRAAPYLHRIRGRRRCEGRGKRGAAGGGARAPRHTVLTGAAGCPENEDGWQKEASARGLLSGSEYAGFGDHHQKIACKKQVSPLCDCGPRQTTCRTHHHEICSPALYPMS